MNLRALRVLPVAMLAVSSTTLAGDWKFGPGIGLSRGTFHFTLGGYVQGDIREYTNWDVTDASLRNDERDIRRVRAGFEAEWRRLSAELDVDPRRAGEQDEQLKDAFLDIRVSKAFRIRGGAMKVPVSGEWLTSARRLDFIERSRLADLLAPGRDWGGMVHGEVGNWLLYQAGVFTGDGRLDPRSAGTTAVGRFIFSPAKGFDLGGSFSRGDVEAQPETGPVELNPKGPEGEAVSGYEFFGRKFIHGERRRLGAEVSLTSGPVALKAEGLWLREQRRGQASSPIGDDLPDLLGRGWFVSATWLVTGEKKGRSVKPARPLFRGPGAIEIGVRYESLHFDDTGPETGFEGVGERSRNIRPAEDRVLTAGLSWWPVRYVRLMGNVVVERFKDPLLAPEAGRRGDYVTLLGRLQVELP